jgi:predicted PurR-regulated permease PerM
LRLSIVVIITVLAIVSAVIVLGFLTNQEYVKVSEITEQIENLEIYKNELEQINQFNLQMLEDLETQIKNSDDIHLEQINDEIDVIKQVIDENKKELEQVLDRLSEMESIP